MKLLRIKTMGSIKVEKQHVKYLNEENTEQNICLNSQTLTLMEKRGERTLYANLGCGQHEDE